MRPRASLGSQRLAWGGEGAQRLMFANGAEVEHVSIHPSHLVRLPPYVQRLTPSAWAISGARRVLIRTRDERCRPAHRREELIELKCLQRA
jgi:hypothetical protein